MPCLAPDCLCVLAFPPYYLPYPALLLLLPATVPCLKRATELEGYNPNSEFAVGGGEEGEEGWVATHSDPAAAGVWYGSRCSGAGGVSSAGFRSGAVGAAAYGEGGGCAPAPGMRGGAGRTVEGRCTFVDTGITTW